MTAVYNEVDEYAAQWLRNLISAGHIAPGDVDTRSIVDVGADDYKDYTQVHLFAGIGGWSLAARIAGWPDERPLWTGSCPCQPFSAAGKRKGTSDERHLWPEMRRLVAACRPDVVAGEQVASKDGRVWLSGVRADLEAMAYASWSVDACSAGVSAPHIRQRIWWIGEATERLRRLADNNSGGQPRLEDGGLQRQPVHDADGRGEPCGLANTGHQSTWRATTPGQAESGRPFGDVAGCGVAGRLANADGRFAGDGGVQRGGQHGQQQQEDGRAVERMGHHHPRLAVGPLQDDGRGAVRHEGASARQAGFDVPWSRYDVVHCTDGKARRFESFAQPLVDGLPASLGRPRTREDVFPLAVGVKNRVGRLRAYGNAINPWLAAEVLGAYLDGEVLRLKPSGFFA